MKRIITIVMIGVIFMLTGCTGKSGSGNLPEDKIDATPPHELNAEDPYLLIEAPPPFNPDAEDPFPQLAELFESNSNELERFVTYLKENDLLDELKQVSIVFYKDKDDALRTRGIARGWEKLVLYDSEIVATTSAPRLVTFLNENLELFNVIREIGDKGVILSVSIADAADADIWIRFSIWDEHVQFINEKGWTGWSGSNFLYIEGWSIGPEIYDDVHIRDNWYMNIGVLG